MDDNIIRILISTDNHLGFAERDPIRCDDALASFEEVFYRAKEKKVDFVLFAGDMFHENRPSRRTLYTAMDILRKYTLGEDPVYLEILNNQSEIFKANNGNVNFEDPFLSVSLPVFSIHGNHDDPSREGGHGDSLSALDLLSVNNMINYFGKTDRVDDIEITPILVKKGNAYVAIYGLGAIRDERLNRMWNQKKVKFVRPVQEQGQDKYFNILVLHQNRDYGRGRKNCLHESMIPEWIDLVIWGNEHECHPSLTESLVGTFRIYQPGSSVACSLSEGESCLFPKHMGLVEIRYDKKFRLSPIKYTEMRPFIYRDVSLENKGLDPHDPKIEDKIRSSLIEEINGMLKESALLSAEYHQNFIADLKYHIKEPAMALLRLRVDPSKFMTINQQRFGSNFVGKVANPADLLLYSRKRKEIHANQNTDTITFDEDLREKETRDLDYDSADIHKIKVEELVVQALGLSNRNLSILAECNLGVALESYVIKKDPNAFADAVSSVLEDTQKELFRSCLNGVTKEEIIEISKRFKQRAEEDWKKGVRSVIPKDKPIIYSDDDDTSKVNDSPQIVKKVASKKSVASQKRTTASKSSKKQSKDSDFEDIIDDDYDDEDPKLQQSRNFDEDEDIDEFRPKSSKQTLKPPKINKTSVSRNKKTSPSEYVEEESITHTFSAKKASFPKTVTLQKPLLMRRDEELDEDEMLANATTTSRKRMLPGSFTSQSQRK